MSESPSPALQGAGGATPNTSCRHFAAPPMPPRSARSGASASARWNPVAGLRRLHSGQHPEGPPWRGNSRNWCQARRGWSPLPAAQQFQAPCRTCWTQSQNLSNHHHGQCESERDFTIHHHGGADQERTGNAGLAQVAAGNKGASQWFRAHGCKYVDCSTASLPWVVSVVSSQCRCGRGTLCVHSSATCSRCLRPGRMGHTLVMPWSAIWFSV